MGSSIWFDTLYLGCFVVRIKDQMKAEEIQSKTLKNMP